MPHFYGVNSIYPWQNWFPVPDEVSMVVLVHAQKSVNFVPSHGFDDKPFIMAKKEKTSALPWVLASFKNHFFVFFAVKWKINITGCDAIQFSDVLKSHWVMRQNFDLLVHHKFRKLHRFLSKIFESRNCFNIFNNNWGIAFVQFNILQNNLVY